MSEKLKETSDILLKKSAEKLTGQMQTMTNYKSLYTEIQKLVTSTTVKQSDFKNTLMDMLKNKGLEIQIKNTVFHWARSQVRN